MQRLQFYIASLFVLLFGIAKGNGQNIIYPDFKTSMLREQTHLDRYLNRKKMYEEANSHCVKLFEDNYNRLAELVQRERNDSYRIPRIVHQIWLGSQVPEKYRAWMETWMHLHGWTYMLWTDEEVKNFRMANRDLYNRSENYGEKSDILRLEILSQYGGLYVDTDFECVKPEAFDELHRCFDFYIGFEPLEHGSIKSRMFKTCNAIIGAIPGHPLIRDLVENMRANFLAYRRHAGPIATTGPSYVTRILCEYMKSRVDDYRNMCFPCTMFYPFSVIDVEDYVNGTLDELPTFPETAAIHYFNMSWSNMTAKEAGYDSTTTQN